MKDVSKELMILYKDALYFHYLREGYTMQKAKFEVKKIFHDIEASFQIIFNAMSV